MVTIPFLREGDRVALAAPARAVSPEEMAPAIAQLESWGLQVVVPKGLYEREGQLAGSDAHRAALMQRLLDDPEVKAIFCCRGGYGTVRIIDRLDFTRFAARPKWIVGYSDITVLHSHIHRTLGLPTLHATMPVNMHGDDTPATESLRKALFGEKTVIEWDPPLSSLSTLHSPLSAPVVGGNLSILYSLCGSCSQVDTRGKILLLEDLDEYLYHIDRMMLNLKRCGMLDGLAGLLVGGLTDMHDNTVPFGRTAMQIVAEAVEEYDYPVLFGAPFGHLGDNNLALPLGVKCTLEASKSKKCRIFAP
ncbi:MAG: LD-carboxypeptidase [Bacteroidales bacterium]|nr:LD-carboxypeptidase [Bacteroidales bacterium]